MANAVEHSASFLRVPNTLLFGVGRPSDTFASLRELGLYMMLSSVLSNPSFTYAAGGMQHLLQLHCKNKYFSLHATWRSLMKKGFLHRTRIPCGTNCFHDYYTLSDEGTPSEGSAICLSAKDGKSFMDGYKPYLPPHTDFTMVSRDVLMDPTLSLAAKGLYAILARQIRLCTQCSEENRPELSKKALRSLCAEGRNAFDGLFRELRTAGYLLLIRSHAYGKLSYIYRLCETPNTAQAETNAPKKQKKAAIGVQNTATYGKMAPVYVKNTPSHVPKRREEEIKEQIEYAILLGEYTKSRLDLIVSIILGASIQRQKAPQKEISLGNELTTAEALDMRLSALDAEDIRFVLDTLTSTEKTTKIFHLRRYLTACLYFAKENLALALDAFSFPKSTSSPIYT